MNNDQFNYHLCGTVVECLSVTQEIVRSSTAIFLKMILFLSLNSGNSVNTFRENSNVADLLLYFDCKLHKFNSILLNFMLGCTMYYFAFVGYA